jgi:molecular chaperone GrpE
MNRKEYHKEACSGDNMTDKADKMSVADEPEVTDSAAGGENGEENGEKNENSSQELTPQEEAAIWRDKYLRLSAEFENYRKRTFKEKLDLINAGGEDVVKAMLEVLDDMDRALAAMDKSEDMEAVRLGIVLIDDKLRGTLKNKGLSEIQCVGEELDADLHEAVARIETAEKDMKDRIVDVVSKGYKLKEKIIRYPKVVVGQ